MEGNRKKQRQRSQVREPEKGINRVEIVIRVRQKGFRSLPFTHKVTESALDTVDL